MRTGTLRLLSLAWIIMFLSQVDRAGAQLRSTPRQGRSGIILGAGPQVLIGDVTGRTVRPPAEQLKLQVEWLAKVGGLEPAEAESLLERGAQTIEKRGLFLQGGNVNERAVRRWQIVDGRLELPANTPMEPASRAIRRALIPFLKGLSPDAVLRVRAERDRLDSYRGKASLLAQVAVLDECLLFSVEQRTRLCASLTETSDAWWRATSPGVMLDTPTQQFLLGLADGGLGEFIAPEADLAKLLRPWQRAAFRELGAPVHDEVLLSQNVPSASVAATLEEQAAAIAKTPHLEGQVVPDRNLEAEEQRLTRALEEQVDDIDAVCQLAPSQREKLILAGKLDIEGFCQPPVAPEKLAEDHVVVQTVRIRAGADVLPLAVFRDQASRFQKALQSVLADEQRKKLIRSRRDFQRQAMVAAVVVGFESSAALTADQCEELARVFEAMSADDDEREATDWRLEWVREIAELPPEKLGHLLFDFQVDAARRHQQRLAEIARRLPHSAPVAIAQVVLDKLGRKREMRLLDDGLGQNGGQE